MRKCIGKATYIHTYIHITTIPYSGYSLQDEIFVNHQIFHTAVMRICCYIIYEPWHVSHHVIAYKITYFITYAACNESEVQMTTYLI